MNLREKRKRLYFATGLLAVVLLVAFYFLVWSPKGKQISAADANLSTLNSQISSATNQITSLKQFQENLPVAQAEMGRLNLAIPQYPQLANFILSLNTISSESGISFISITSAQPTAPTTVTAGVLPLPPQVQLGIQVQGGYFQVLDFMNRLDHLPRLVVATSVNLSTNTNSAQSAAGGSTNTATGSSGSEISGSIKAVIYSQTIPNGVPGASSTTTVSSTTTTAASSAGATTTTTSAG